MQRTFKNQLLPFGQEGSTSSGVSARQPFQILLTDKGFDKLK
jgi:hypothetical protein